MKKEKGFTLVELAIVIVIIGLIISGIVGGQSLIRSAKIRSIISDLNKYETAVRAFQLEYDSLPGDMRDASDYWSGESDGDGDNFIDGVAEAEELAAWQHLIAAEIVRDNLIGDGYMASDFGNFSAWWLGFPCSVSVPCTIYGNVYGSNAFLFSKIKSSGAINEAILSPKDARDIDGKIDDKKATTGRLISLDADNPAGICVATDYNLAVTGPSCRFLYSLAN